MEEIRITPENITTLSDEAIANYVKHIEEHKDQYTVLEYETAKAELYRRYINDITNFYKV